MTQQATETLQTEAKPVEVYRPRSVWVRAWPIYPILLFLAALFVYPVAQLLSLSVFDSSAYAGDAQIGFVGRGQSRLLS